MAALKRDTGAVRTATWAIVLALLVAACSGEGGDTTVDTGSVPDAGEIVFVAPGGSFGAAFNAAFLTPFSQESGVSIEQVSGGDNPIAQVQAQVESGNVQWDIIGCVATNARAFPDLWEPVEGLITPPNDLVSQRIVADLYVAADLEVHPLLAYSTEEFPDDAPESWADFFDVETFPGPRGLSNLGLDSAWYVPAVALLADGVAPDELFPLDLDRAYAKLDELKPHVGVFWTSFGQSQDILRSGEVVMNLMTDGRALQLKNSGAPVDVTFNQAFERIVGRCVLKDAPNKENAMELLQFILDNPEQQGIFTSLTYYGPVTEAGVAAAERLGVTEFSSAFADSLIPESEELLNYVSENQDELLERWNAWVAG